MVCTVRSHTLFRRRPFFFFFFFFRSTCRLVRSHVVWFLLFVLASFFSYDGCGQRDVVFRTRVSIDTVWMQNHGCDAMDERHFLLNLGSLWDPRPPFGMDGSNPMDVEEDRRIGSGFVSLGWDTIRSIDTLHACVHLLVSFYPYLASGTHSRLSVRFLFQRFWWSIPTHTKPRLLGSGNPMFVHLLHLPFLCGCGPFVPVSHTPREPTSTTGRRTRRETKKTTQTQTRNNCTPAFEPAHS